MNKSDRNMITSVIAPYRGNKPYIFISYSHKDKGLILPILDSMLFDNYRVWFDEGIVPGTEWDQNIAAHIEKSDYFIAFISNNYISSENCKDELNYARDLNKKRVLVYLEHVDLPAGMAMRLNRLQAIHYYVYETQEAFLEKLYDADGIKQFCDKHGMDFESSELVNIPKLTINICKKFSEGSPNYRFVFVYGWEYKSKKALMSAIKSKLTERKVDFELVLMEHFTDELIDALRNDKTKEMRRRYEDIPVLILDGIEAIAGKSATQEEIYRYIRHRFYEDKPTMIMSPKKVEERGFDKRIMELVSDWEKVST